MNAPLARRVETPPGVTPHSLPAWVYNHPEMTRLEYERILKPSWQIACHISQIPESGDYVTFELGSDSVIVLREGGGGIRALRNVCRHRGTRLLEGSGRCLGRITCPYHGWTYRYDGSLLATPARDSFPNLDLREHSLAAVHLEVALGFVWVCLAADAPPPPSEMWAPVMEELAPYGSRSSSRRSPCISKNGTSTGRSRWTTTSSPTTCRSGIRGSTVCSRPTTKISAACLALPAVSAGCVSRRLRAGASASIRNTWAP